MPNSRFALLARHEYGFETIVPAFGNACIWEDTKVVIFFSLTEAPLPDPTPTIPTPILDKNHAIMGPEFYPVLRLGSGGRLLRHFQTPVP